MALPMVGGVYLDHLWRGTSRKLRAMARPLLKDGIGDRMDKGNLWVVPGFTLLVFAILWTTKLSKIALEESKCHGASIYDFGVKQLEDDAKSHCQTAKRYYVGPDEAFSHDHNWRQQREVKNPEWILWFWAPIVFVMYVLTRFMWTLLLENQGINFANVVAASQSITVEHDGITELDEEKLADRLPVIVENFRCAYSSRAYAAFLAFEWSLVVAPLLLLLFVLPLMIGGAYRTWGLDIARAWWERRDWQGAPLLPFYDVSGGDFHEASQRRPVVPLIPRITYCDYHFVSLGNSHTLTYRCYMDANWHERTALFTWVMLLFLALINLGNLVFWLEWTVRMRFRHERGDWVINKWLNTDGFTGAELDLMRRFAEGFKMGQLLYFYYIEAHTDRVVASAFCTALFARWLEQQQQRCNSAALTIGEMPRDDDSAAPSCGNVSGTAKATAAAPAAMPLMPSQRPIPTAPCPTSPSAASFSDASTALMKRGGSRLHSVNHSPHSSPGDGPLELTLTTPSISALIGRQQARSPNLAIEIGRRSLGHGFEEEQRRAERRRQVEEWRRTELEEAQKTKQQQKEDKSSSSSISSDSSQDEDGGVVTERVPKNLKKRSATVTEKEAPQVVEEEQREQQQNETAKRKQIKDKSLPGKKGNGGAFDDTKCDSAGKASFNAPGAGGGQREAAAATDQRQDEEAEEKC